jgi:hypothetical protein
VYLRVSEAQRCRVHSTLMVPIFGSDSRDTPLAVFELVQGDRDVTFPAVLSQLTTSLQVGCSSLRRDGSVQAARYNVLNTGPLGPLITGRIPASAQTGVTSVMRRPV